MTRVCLAVTDVVSFNVLCKGQLEFLRDSGGYDLTLICGGDREGLEKLRSRGFEKILYLPFSRRPNLVLDTRCLFKLIWVLLSNRFDLVISSTPKAMLLVSMAAFLTCQRVRVAIMRGRVYENFHGIRRSLYQFLDLLVGRTSTSVLFISRSLMKVCLQDGTFATSKCSVLGSGSSNGVDVVTFRPSNVSRPSSKFKIVVVGRACRDKGVIDFFHIVSKVANLGYSVAFEWVGAIEDSLADSIFADLKATGIFVHKPHIADVQEVYQSASVHLFLSYREGFGNVAIEAAACGIPTISYDVVGVKDSVADGISGYRLPFGDIEGVVEAILQIRDAQLSGDTLFPNARDWVVENFEQNLVWRRYLEFYNDALSR